MILENKINEAITSYPKAVCDYMWKVSYSNSYYLCLNFDKENAGKTYPISCTTKGSLSITNREYIYFLTKEDAEKFLRDILQVTVSRYNIYLSRDKTKAVRIDNNGNVPVYADEIFIKVCLQMKLKSKLIPEYVKENLKGPFVTNNFLAGSADEKVKRKLAKEQKGFNLLMLNTKTIVDWADSHNYIHSDIKDIYTINQLTDSFYVCVPLADIASKNSIKLPSIIYKYVYITACCINSSTMGFFLKASNLEPSNISPASLDKEKDCLTKEFNYSCNSSEKAIVEKSIDFFTSNTTTSYTGVWKYVVPTDMFLEVINISDSRKVVLGARASYDTKKSPRFLLFDMSKDNVIMRVINTPDYASYRTINNNYLYFSEKEPITNNYIDSRLSDYVNECYGLKISENDEVKKLTDMWLVLDNSLKPRKLKVDKEAGKIIW